MGTFYYFATDLSWYEEGNTEFGGILKRLVFEGNTAPAQIIPVRPTPSCVRRSRRPPLKCPVTGATIRSRSPSSNPQDDVRLPLSVIVDARERTANGRISGRDDSSQRTRVEQMGRPRLHRQPVRAPETDGAVSLIKAADMICSSTCPR